MKNKGEKAENLFVRRLLDECPGIIVRNPRDHEEVSTADAYKPHNRCKSDVTLDFSDGVRYECSIKCVDAAPYAIVNHTSGLSRVWSSILDAREQCVLEDFVCDVIRGRDVHIGKLDDMTDEQHRILRKVVSYFAFEGSGCGVSARPATRVIYVDKFGNPVTAFKTVDTYLDDIMPKLQISVRSKGGKCKESWGGNLHIRVCK